MIRSLIKSTVLIGSLTLSGFGFSPAANAESEIIFNGTFEGRTDHIVTGGVTVLKTDSGTVVVLESDFSLDNAPDPKLGFGKDGYDPSTKFSHLESHTGAQIYVISEDINPDEYNEIWVWCEKFNVPLGVAKVN
ncbi:MAG: DM13 domain-containing protein [Symploca sp. SIO2C1]|nr:DM13 domain-containing protein [Symploca sp. SIO2C1]